MNRRTAAGLAGTVCPGFFAFYSAVAAGDRGGTQQPHWVENKGQFDSRVLYRSEGAQETIWLLDDEIWLTVSGPARMGGFT